MQRTRTGLKEQNFRRFESILASACKGTYIFFPSDLVPPMSQGSCVARLHDARKGFELFGYRSTEIPSGYEMRRIRIYEQDDGSIMLKNEYEDRKRVNNILSTSEPSLTIIKGEVVAWTQKERAKDFTKISASDVAHIQDICRRLDSVEDDALNPYTTWVLIETDGTDTQYQALCTLCKGVSLERLAEGFVRLT